MRTLWNAVRAVAWTLWGAVLVLALWAGFIDGDWSRTVPLALFWISLPVQMWFWMRVLTILERYGR